MFELRSATRHFVRRAALTASALSLLTTIFVPDAAQARHRYFAHRSRLVFVQRTHARFRPVVFHGGGFVPAFAAIAVDGNSGRILYARDEDASRHPASITKVMTLYLLFEQLEKGRLTLDTRIEVSPHAASQSPTKLGLRAGSSIRVEDAIKSIVTESANDMAVAVAEQIGGDEDTFASMMTRKARGLGMSRTTFVNASGLPDDRQITTARDLSILGRAIHDHYPRYFRFFSTPSFRYAGRVMANHNHLMEQVEGMDGIKTGYTRSSGFNLLSSVNRNGHWLVSVVLGGRTRLGRDRIMADLIASQIDNCATRRTAPMIAETALPEPVAEVIPVVRHEGEIAPPVEAIEDRFATAAAHPLAPIHEPSDDEVAPVPVPRAVPPAKPVVAPIKVASLTPDVVTPRPRPAFVSGTPKAQDRDMTATGSIRPRRVQLDGSSSHYIGAATATPSTIKHSPRREREEAKDKPTPIRVASLDGQASGRPASMHGWMVQIGATPTIVQANELISRARSESRGALAAARPFTEKIRKGRETLFRARFSGLEQDAAGRACTALKRAGISCFPTKN